jgi:membrane protease YdiL (CAAX protease family)
MLGVFDHVLAAILVVLGPVWAATFGYRRLLRAPEARRSSVRRSLYSVAIAMQWSLTAVALILWLVNSRPWNALGLQPLPTAGLGGVVLGTAIVIALVWRQRVRALADDEALAEVRARMRHVEPMLPHDSSELRLFYALSVTAGICEEVLYRGFMLWYLGHYLGIVPAVLVAAVIFGVGHSYQGPRGVVLTAAVGGFLAVVYLVAGSLYPCFVLHALMDVHSGHLAQVALRRTPSEPDLSTLEAWTDAVLQEDSIAAPEPPQPERPS